MQIEDGTGRGFKVKVSKENFMEVHAITQSVESHVNHVHGNSYHCVFNQSPTAGDDCFFYMVNNSDDNHVIIEGVYIGMKNATAADAEIYFKLGAKGTRGGVTVLTPVNCNTGSGMAAVGTFEKGADLEGGGTLTGGSEIERYVIAGVNDLVSTHFNFEQDIILVKNETLTIWATDAGATYYITVVFNFHLPE
jgi:hypothetical protein